MVVIRQCSYVDIAHPAQQFAPTTCLRYLQMGLTATTTTDLMAASEAIHTYTAPILPADYLVPNTSSENFCIIATTCP